MLRFSLSVQDLSNPLASLLWLAFICGGLIIPFSVAFAAGSFWLKSNTFIEKPMVQIRNEFQMMLDGYEKVANGALWVDSPLQITYSSNPYVNQHASNPRVSSFKVSFVFVCLLQTFTGENNTIGTTDYFWVNASIPLSPFESIHQVRLAFTFQITLSVRFEC